MSEHYIVTLDAGHLRIYAERSDGAQFTPSLVPVEAVDLPLGKKGAVDREVDAAGRFPGSKEGSLAPGVARSGMSIDERLPMHREEHRRRARELASMVESFLDQREEA